MSDPYLIAHLVRGSPAFDIAIRCDDMGTESDPGPWWIVPTSGHRAYPYQIWKLRDMAWHDGTSNPMCGRPLLMTTYPAPTDHPDHYTTYAAPRQGLITNLAERLGFVPKPTTITRR